MIQYFGQKQDEYNEKRRKLDPTYRNRPFTPSILRNGRKIKFFESHGVKFKDAMEFTSGTTLDNFGKIWKANCQKGIYPYEKYTSMAELREDIHFPNINEFHSNLRDRSKTISIENFNSEISKLNEHYEKKKMSKLFCLPESVFKENAENWSVFGIENYTSPVSVADYVASLNLFDRKRAENPNYTMLDYLKWYNHLDTKLLSQALLNFSAKFWEFFEVNPFDHFGLPGIAEAITHKQWNTEHGNLMTFHEDFDFLYQKLRKSMRGGLTYCTQRHIEIGNTRNPYTKAVSRAKNGKPYKYCVQKDHTA